MLFRWLMMVASLLMIFSAHATSSPWTLNTEKNYQQAVLNEVNRYRATKRLPPLVLNTQMNQEAKQHSLDMAQKKMPFGHQDFDVRVAHIKRHLPQFAGGAENIAMFKIPPHVVVQKWLTSRGHRRNIEGHYNLTGIGVVQDAHGWVYYTQLFAKA